MWTAHVEMSRPRFERLSNVRLVDGNDKVQALSARGSNEPLAKRVGLRRFVWGLQDR